MCTYYPELRKKERIRYYLMLVAVFLPFILPIVCWVAFESWVLSGVGAIVGVSVSIKTYQFVNRKLVIICPVCNIGVLTENYANTPRGTDYNVEHKCSECKALFIDAKLQKET
jgi:hypothetical protein